MDSASFFKRTLEYQKTAFDAGYNTMVILQGHAEKMTSDLLERSQTPKEGVEVLSTSINEYKKQRDDLKKIIDESFTKLNNIISF